MNDASYLVILIKVVIIPFILPILYSDYTLSIFYYHYLVCDSYYMMHCISIWFFFSFFGVSISVGL